MSRRVLPLRLAALLRFSAIRADLPDPHRKRRSDFPGPPRKRKSGFFQSRRHDRRVSAARPQRQYVESSFGCASDYQVRVRAFPQG